MIRHLVMLILFKWCCDTALFEIILVGAQMPGLEFHTLSLILRLLLRSEFCLAFLPASFWACCWRALISALYAAVMVSIAGVYTILTTNAAAKRPSSTLFAS